MRALRTAAAEGGLRQLTRLCLSNNRIGCEGAAALAAAAAAGGLPSLQLVVLERNRIGSGGMRALAEAVETSDAFAGCTADAYVPRARVPGIEHYVFLKFNDADAAPVLCALSERKHRRCAKQ